MIGILRRKPWDVLVYTSLFLWAGIATIGCEPPKENADAVLQETVAEKKRQHTAGGIVFAEDFESRELDEVLARWNDRKNARGMTLVADVPPGSKGSKSLEMTYVAGENEGGHLFKQLPDNYDSLYARFYVKFLTRQSKIHHFVKLGGYNPPVGYPLGKAGLKPDGTDFFISGIECPMAKSWEWGFYTYWKDMQGSDRTGYWGNTFRPEKPVLMKQGEWTCVEFMLKLNNPESGTNGEQAFWINGEKILHLGENFPLMSGGGNKIESKEGEPFPGFQWSSDESLKLNFFWLNYYMTKGNPGDVDKVLFDEIVVATNYIGPLKND